MPTHNSAVRSYFDTVLQERGVLVHKNDPVIEVSAGVLKTQNGKEFTTDEILWVTAAGAPQWPADAGLDVNQNGFIRVGDTLQSISHPDIFAAGDIAAMVNYPRPKSGVFAVRQGQYLSLIHI